MDSDRTLGHGLGCTGAGLARIPYVSGGAHCLQGLECRCNFLPGCRGLVDPSYVANSAARPIYIYASLSLIFEGP